MTTYRVKEIFGPTIQGEGAHAGAACVFLRFAACNLACTWCDTDFTPDGAPFMAADEIARALLDADAHHSRRVIVTGGEPALQWSSELASALKDAGFTVHMESNGTRQLAAPVDWLTVSPKPRFHPAGIELADAAVLSPNECKVVVDETVDETQLDFFETLYRCEARFLQPCMDARYDAHLARSLELVARRPAWRLSLQLHKIVGLP